MQAAVTRRNIQSLYHFTKLENIDSIMQHGIIPRDVLDKRKLKYEFNDNIRLDYQQGASSFSIEHPNYKMFFPCRVESQKINKDQKWVVIGVQRNVLWDKDCAFCHENAASANVTAIPIMNRKGKDAFEKLFEPIVGKPTRAELKLPDSFPTNPQAEVLIFDTVEPKYILSLVCETEELAKELKVKYPGIHVVKHPHYFSARFDYKAWK